MAGAKLNLRRDAESGVGVVPLLAVIGSINVDVVLRLDRFPLPGETLLAAGRGRTPGGKGGNQAAAAAQLADAPVLMVGTVGDDLDGAWVRGQLDAAGVTTSAVRVAENCATGLAFVSLDAHGENTIVVSAAANAHAFPDGALLPTAEGYLFSLEIPLDAVVRAVEVATGFVAVNASPALALPASLIERTDLFIVNETEFALMPELSDASEVVETRGASGVRIHRRGELVAELEAAQAERVVSTVGAGDAFCAAVVVGRLQGMGTEAAVSAATYVGAAAVAQPDAQPRLRSLEHYAGLSLGWPGGFSAH